MTDELGKHDTTIEDLASQLPAYMPKDPDSGNRRLFNPIAKEIDTTVSDKNAVDRALTAQHADTIEQLEKIGRLVNLRSHDGESLEHYRARIIAEFQLVTSKGTVRDLLNAVSTILDVPKEALGYTETHTSSAGNARVSVPQTKLKDVALTDGEFADIAERTIAASYRLDVFKAGTFTYLSESDYTGSGTYDSTDLISNADFGHDGLDTNDNPKDNGGTYAGVL